MTGNVCSSEEQSFLSAVFLDPYFQVILMLIWFIHEYTLNRDK